MDGIGKKVLYISYDGMTDPLGQSQVIPYLQGLTKKGYVFSLVSFEKKEKFKERGSHIQKLMDLSGIKWYPQSFSINPPLFSKIYDMWKMKRVIRRLQQKQHFDLIHCRSYVPVEAGLFLKRKFGIPVLFDMRGFWADEKKEAGGKVWKFLYSIYKAKEKKFLTQSDLVVTLTNAARNEILSWKLPGISEEKIHVIPCCADLDLFSPVRPDEQMAKVIINELGINQRSPIITYLGSLGPQYGIHEMLFFFQSLKQKHPFAKFIFFTKDDKSLVLNLLKDYTGISKNDLFFLFVERSKIPAYLSFSDFSIFFYYPSYSRLACSPTKFAELLGMNIPVICNHVGDLNQSFVPVPPNIILDSLSKVNLENAANQLVFGDKNEVNGMRDFALKNFSLDKGVQAYNEIYNSIVP